MTGPARPRRGPPGAAPLPPPWLGDIDLPITTVPAGTDLYRIHRLVHGPIFFGPGPGQAPLSRFDCLSGRFGVLYVGLGFAGALAETLLRNPNRLLVSTVYADERAASVVTCRRDLRVVTLHGQGLGKVGTDNAISTGPYEPCGAWADALWDHRDQPDGLAYRSRHDPDEICLALFERPDLPGAFEAQPPTPLRDRHRELALLLARYGKSLDDPAW